MSNQPTFPITLQDLRECVEPARRLAFSSLSLNLGEARIDVRFHYSRFGGREAARRAAATFIKGVAKDLARPLASLRKLGRPLPMANPRGDGLPAGVAYVAPRQIVTARARRETLGTLRVNELGLGRALQGGCDLRLERQSDEFELRQALISEIWATVRLWETRMPVALSIYGAEDQGGLSSLRIQPRRAANGGLFAWEVCFGSLLRASFAWRPTQAQLALRQARAFKAAAAKTLRAHRRFVSGLSRAGIKARAGDLPRGIRRTQEHDGRIAYTAFWVNPREAGKCDSAKFVAAPETGGDAGALRLALEARERGLRRANTVRARQGLVMLSHLKREAERAGGECRIAGRREVLAALLAA